MENRDEFDEEMDKREFRRKRRVRNQIISYVSVAVFLTVVIVAAVLGVRRVVTVMNDKKQAAELQNQLNDLAESEPEQAVVEAPVATTAPENEKSYLDEIVDSCIAEMPLEDKVAGLFIITPEALTGTDVAIKAGDKTKERLSQYAVGGLVYFKQNIKTAEQLAEMINTTKSLSKYPLFIAVDEEGGTVSRVAAEGLADDVGKMGDIGAGGDTVKAKEAGAAIGGYLTTFGFNLNFAPVADVIAEGNTTIGDRSFGTDPQLVSTMVAAAVEGLKSAGVSACLKHFPGLGDTSEDTHEGMAVSERTQEEFAATDFLSFKAGIDAGADFVMVGHLSVPNIIGDNTPSCLSSKIVTEILRGDMGFGGAIITDSLSMTAVTDYFTAEEAAIKALEAGADMLLMPEDFESAYNGVLGAVQSGTLSEERINESLKRIYRIKYADKVEESGTASGSDEQNSDAVTDDVVNNEEGSSEE